MCRISKIITFLESLRQAGWFDLFESDIQALLIFDPLITLWGNFDAPYLKLLNDASMASACFYVRTCRRVRNSKKIATIRDFHLPGSFLCLSTRLCRPTRDSNSQPWDHEYRVLPMSYTCLCKGLQYCQGFSIRPWVFLGSLAIVLVDLIYVSAIPVGLYKGYPICGLIPGPVWNVKSNYGLVKHQICFKKKKKNEKPLDTLPPWQGPSVFLYLAINNHYHHHLSMIHSIIDFFLIFFF